MATNQEIVLITGSNTGIGLEIARKLLRDYDDRFYVLIGGRTMSKVDATVQELHKHNLKSCEGIQIEVTKDASIDAAAKVVKDKFGRLDVLHVNVRNRRLPRPCIYSNADARHNRLGSPQTKTNLALQSHNSS